MGYSKVMGYALILPANELGGQQKLWVTAEFGLIQVWVISEATVIPFRSRRLKPLTCIVSCENK